MSEPYSSDQSEKLKEMQAWSKRVTRYCEKGLDVPREVRMGTIPEPLPETPEHKAIYAKWLKHLERF